jgi:hypothetical protein
LKVEVLLVHIEFLFVDLFWSVPMPDHEAIFDSQFTFEGLMIKRVIIHRIFPRKSGNSLIPPRTSNKLIDLEQEAKDALQKRITKALASRSHGIEMSIIDIGDSSFFQTAAAMLYEDECNFIETSKQHAEDLNKYQSHTNAPGGLLAEIAGCIGNDSRPFIASIKAEPQDGFRADEQDGNLGMEYIDEVLFTESQRFYKIGLLAEIASNLPGEVGYQPDNYRAFLFDHLMTTTETRSAAVYFYKDFLGMDIQKSAKKLTQNFFEYTKEFINDSSMPDEEKNELHEALRTELRSQEAIISSFEFARKHLKAGQDSQYNDFMQKKKFPQNSVSKDTEYIQAKLKRRRKFIFDNKVEISIPPDNASNFLEIEPLDEPGVTIVKIKGRLKGQG